MKTKEGKRLETHFGQIGGIKGTFCPKIGTIKDTNSRDLIDTEEIKKIWKEYMHELYKKDRDDQDDYNAVVSLPEPDILENKVKWVLGSTALNKISRCDGIPVEQLKNPKGWCHQGVPFYMSANQEDPAVATGLGKIDLHPNSQEG